MDARIRPATADDAAALLAIYAPVVRETAITFELEPPSVGEIAERVRTIRGRWPWLVLEEAGVVAGYAYASTWRARAAYQWAVESTVYVRANARHRGVGRAVYRALLACLRLQGVRLAIGGITLPNPASVRLHEALGFQCVGVHPACGYKHAAWHDVGFWQLELGARDLDPAAPRAAVEIEGSPAWAAAMASGLDD
jgi:phosphinothricin acetyltransferase